MPGYQIQQNQKGKIKNHKKQEQTNYQQELQQIQDILKPMQPYRVTQSLISQQYMFTVSNPSHELVTPDQYTQLVSTMSQYQLIPGFLNDYIDDPWDVVMKLLPYSKNTIIDVTLPYWPNQRYIDGVRRNDNRTLGRYILYKQQVIGIRVRTSSSKSSASHQPPRPPPSTLIQQRFKCRQQPFPPKLATYYTQKKIQPLLQSLTVGDFYLTTSKFKLAILFQSEIIEASLIDPYLMMGCEVVSIVNDEEVQYENFVNYYLKNDYHDLYIEGNNSVIKTLRQICWKANMVFLYGGCKTVPSLGKVYFTRSFIEYGKDFNHPPKDRAFQTEDVEFFPLIDLTQHKDFLSEPQYNSNRLNVCRNYNIARNRAQRAYVSQILTNPNPAINQQLQLQSLPLDSKKFEIRPLSKQSQSKLQKLEQMNFIYDRQKLFNLAQLTGKSIIRCMYVFNMINLFIFSKPKHLQSPFLLAVPFTPKTKNLFDIIVYIYDNIKNYEANAPDLDQDISFFNILQLYRYKDDRNLQHNFEIEEEMLKSITGRKDAQIPTIEQLIKQHDRIKAFYLCSDDVQEKKKMKIACKQANIQLTFVDVLTIDEFSLPLEIRSTHDPDIDSILELDKYQNFLENYTLQMREMSSSEQMNFMRQKEPKKVEYSPKYMKICQELQKKNFLSINQALRWIIVDKEFPYDEEHQNLFNELVLNELGKKIKSNIRTLSQINTFFIANSEEQIKRKVAQMSQQIMGVRMNSLKSLSSNSRFFDLIEGEEEEKQNNNTSNSKTFKNQETKKGQQRQKSPDELYLLRLEKCKRLKAQRKKLTLTKCHRCLTELDKKYLEKCKKCNQMMCLQCIEEISGLSGPKASQEFSKLCSVCNRLCECEKCKRKLEKLIANGVSKELMRFDEFKNIMMEDQNNHPKSTQHTNTKQSDVITNVTQFLFKTISSQPHPSTQLQCCQRCQIVNPSQKRNICVQCISCGLQECYFCIQQLYKETNYKSTTSKYFYKNWKCEECDPQWLKFLENRKLQAERITKEQQFIRMIEDMDVQVNSNHTSHYANENLMDIAGFNQPKTDPRMNFYAQKRKPSIEVQNQTSNQRKDSFSDVAFVSTNLESHLDKKIDKNLDYKTPYFNTEKQTVFIPETYPPPSPKLPTQSEQPQQVTPIEFIKESKKKNIKNSSDSGYESNKEKKKKKTSKNEGASSVQVSFRDQKKHKNTKSGPLWPNKGKKSKRSSSRSNSKKSSDSKSSENDSLASFNPKKSMEKLPERTGQMRKENDEKRRKREFIIPNPVNEREREKRERRQRGKRGDSYESGMINSSSNSSSSQSSSSSSRNSSSGSSQNKKYRKIKSKPRKRVHRSRSSSSGSSSKSSRKKSSKKSMRFSRSSNGSVRRQQKRSDSGRNDRDEGRGNYRGRGSQRGRGGWNSNYTRDRGSYYDGEERGYNGDWRGSSNFDRGQGSSWRGRATYYNNNENQGHSSNNDREYHPNTYRGGFGSYRGRDGFNSNYSSRDPYFNRDSYSNRDSYPNNTDHRYSPSSRSYNNTNHDNGSQTYRSSRFYGKNQTQDQNITKNPDKSEKNQQSPDQSENNQQKPNNSGLLFQTKTPSNLDQTFQY